MTTSAPESSAAGVEGFIPPLPMRPATWRLCCLLCGRTHEVLRPPRSRRCPECGGYLEAWRTREWEAC